MHLTSEDSSPPLKPVYGLVFFSGFAGLIYEIAWIRRSALAFGSSSLALSTVLAVFFLGMGLGSLAFGRLGVRLRHPLLWCAGLEGLLALNGLVSGALFEGAESVFGIIYRTLEPDSAGLSAWRGLLLTLLLLPPTLLMGGTLPLFCRETIRESGHITVRLGRLYGSNTLGAAFGCMTAGFWLLPTAGLDTSLRIAAIINAGVGLGFILLGAGREALPEPARGDTIGVDSDRSVPVRWLTGLLFFTLGAVALANEVLWARFLTHFIRNSVYTYTLTLGIVLFGAALGSFLAAPGLDRMQKTRDRLMLFALLQAVTAILTPVLTHWPAAFWRALPEDSLWPFAILMLPQALLSGICFPLANRMVNQAAGRTARDVGLMTALNILGCVTGSWLTGFWLLPAWGLDASLYVVALPGLVMALVAWGYANGWRLPSDRSGRISGAGVVGMLLIWSVFRAFPPLHLPEHLAAPGEVWLDWVEGYNSNLAVVARNDVKTLLIDRLWQGVEQRNYQIMVAHVPMLHQPIARDILVIGLGAGTTASRFLQYDIRRLDVIDIEPRLFAFSRKHFPAPWWDDVRVHALSGDGRNHVKHTDRHYDFISVEIGQLDRPGVGGFYTREFYREARARLNAAGMIAQFVPLRFLKAEDFASLLATFIDVFPKARLWYNTGELLLLGFRDELPRLTPEAFARVSERPGIATDLDFNYWGGPHYSLKHFSRFAAGFLAQGEELQALTRIAPAEHYSDDRLQLSYRVSDYRPGQERATALVPALKAHLSPLEQAIELQSLGSFAVKNAYKIRESNVGDIAASDILDRMATQPTPPGPAWIIEQASQALQWNPHNLEAIIRLRDAQASSGQNDTAIP